MITQVIHTSSFAAFGNHVFGQSEQPATSDGPDFFCKRVPFFRTYHVCESEVIFSKKASVLRVTAA